MVRGDEMNHEMWCMDPAQCVCREVPNYVILSEVRELKVTLAATLEQVTSVVEQAKPALEQVMNSPIMAMLTGGKKK